MPWTTDTSLWRLLALLGCLPGVRAIDLNGSDVYIIVATVGVVILIIAIIIMYCVLCRKKKEKQQPDSRSSLQRTANNSSSGHGTPPLVVPPGVWTTNANPKLYAGMPNDAYKIAKTNHGPLNGPDKARYPYVNGSPANRHFTSNPDLAEQRPDYVSSKVRPTSESFFYRTREHLYKAPGRTFWPTVIVSGKVRPPPNPVKSQPDIAKLSKRPRSDHTKGIVLHDEDNLSGSLTRVRVNNGGPTARVYVNYETPPPSPKTHGPKDPFVAKVYSDYSEPKDAIRPSNVSKQYASREAFQNPSVYVAQSMIRSHDSGLNATSQTNLFQPQPDRSLPKKPIQRTQSNMEKSRPPAKEKRNFFGKRKSSKAKMETVDNNKNVSKLPGHAPYGKGLVITRSPSELTSNYHLRRDKSGLDEKDRDRRLGVVMRAGGQLTRPERPISDYATLPGEDLSRPVPVVKRSVSDAASFRPNQPQAEAVYAVPNKIRKPPPPPGSPVRQRQREPSVPESPATPLPPPVPPHPRPEFLLNSPDRERHISEGAISTTTSEAGSIGKAGVRITTAAFDFLESYCIDDSVHCDLTDAGVLATAAAFQFLESYSPEGSPPYVPTAPGEAVDIITTAFDFLNSYSPRGSVRTETSQLGSDSHVQQLFHFLDSYPITSPVFDSHARPQDDKTVLLDLEEEKEGSLDSRSLSSASGPSIVEASDKIASQAFSFLDDFEDEDLQSKF